MAGPAFDFLLETCSASGTADYSLGGPPASTPYRGAVAQATTGGVLAYVVVSDVTFKWEIGYGTVTDASPDTLTRNVKKSWDGTTLSDSAKVNWNSGDGTLRMYCAPAAFLINGALTHHRGTTAPTPAFAGYTWEDITSLTAVVWKHYDGADWITFPWVINETANTITLADGSVTNAMLADMGAATFKGRISGTGAPQDLTDQQAASLLYIGADLISGLTYSNNVSDATNDIDIAAGVCQSDDASYGYWIELAAITKRLDAAWAVGTNQGGLDTGSIANTDYYIWAIARSDTGVTDVLFSTSSTSPTMPANYDYKRLIGWFKRASATIVPFKTTEMSGGGLEFRWITQRLDVDLSNTLTTSRRTDALSVPLNFSTMATVIVLTTDASANHNEWIGDPSETDGAPSVTAVPLANIVSATATYQPKQFRIRTSAAGLIAARSTLATVDSYKVSTAGWEWSRR